MAMDALKNVVTNVPDWLKRLDELNSQIDQRQVELATFTDEVSTSTRSMRNKGSTESLKPKNEGDPFLSPVEVPSPTTEPTSLQTTPPVAPESSSGSRPGAVTPPNRSQTTDPAPPTSPGTPTALQRQTQQAMAVAQKRARAQVRKRHRTESMISAEGAPSKYRTRSMIIVYYDSYVQSFFEELVKFISASRNLMRKAKMAAKVAQIKRMAELEMPDEDDEADDDDNGPLAPLPPSLAAFRAGGSRAIRPMRGLPSFAMAGGRSLLGDDAQPDAYDELDKGLEYVQSMSEHAAHQFLRAGECDEEIANVKRRLAETHELAQKELDRVMRDEPELAKETGDLGKPRTLRQTSMRREPTPKREFGPPSSPMAAASPSPAPVFSPMATPALETPATQPSSEGPARLEVDPMIEADDDEGVEDMDMPVLVYKTARNFRSVRR